MAVLTKGANIALPSTSVRAVLGWTGGNGVPDVDASALLLTASGKVRNDHDFVFYNEPKHPTSGVVHTGKQASGSGGACDTVAIDLAGVEPAIEKVLITASVDAGTFGQVPDLRLQIIDAGTGEEVARFDDITMSSETALVAGELYRRGDVWKFRAVGQGWDTGLAGVATTFGITVDSEPAAPTAPTLNSAPASSAPTGRFTKGEDRLSTDDRAKLNLRKRQVAVSLHKRGAAGARARVLLVLDASGSMRTLYKQGVVKTIVERMAAVAAQLDDDGTMQVWAFAEQPGRLTDLHIAGMPGWLDTELDLAALKQLGGRNNEPPVIAAVREFVREHPAPEPALVLFFSDGGVAHNTKIEKQLREASDEPIFWQFIGLGRSNYGILERFDTLPNRRIDNVGFFAVDDITNIGDPELYDRLLSDFPSWLRAARAEGIL